MLYKTFRTQAEFDAAYDVEASVPDFMVYARMFTQASADTREALPCVQNVRYGPTMAEYVDIFPAGRRGAPVLIFIHGGYWKSLTAKEFSFAARGFATRGVTVVIANYEICPAVTIPEITRQMRAMVAWVADNIDRYDGDPENITVTGHSAGGHLTAMCALTDWAGLYGLPANVIRHAVPISGLFDLEPISLTYMQPELRITQRAIDECSPQRLVRRVPCDMVLTYGTDEPAEFSRHSEEFLAAWRDAGNRARFFPQLGRNHFTAITDLGDPDAPLTQAIFDLMEHDPRPAAREGRVDRRLFPRERAR